jgi:hypothetical protein
MKRLIADLVRFGLLTVVTGVLLLFMDPANIVVIQALGIALFMVGGTHFTRRLLFHRLDLQQIAEDAIKNNSMPAAIVFVAICVFLVCTMFLSMSVLR